MVNTDGSEDRSLYLAVGGGQSQGHTGHYIPMAGQGAPQYLCRVGAWRSPSVMISLVNTVILEVSREGYG